MNKNIKIEDYQSDIKQGNYEKIMDIIEGRALDLIKEIAAEQNIELSLENNANKEKKYYAIIRCFDGNNSYF